MKKNTPGQVCIKRVSRNNTVMKAPIKSGADSFSVI
jgi:hypothetical protein